MELRAQKLEEPTIIIETELDEKLEEKLREEFRSLGPTSSNYARWKKRTLQNGTLKKELGIHGGDIIRVTKEVRKVETEKLVVNFPVDVSLFYFLQKKEKPLISQTWFPPIDHLGFFKNFQINRQTEI